MPPRNSVSDWSADFQTEQTLLRCDMLLSITEDPRTHRARQMMAESSIPPATAVPRANRLRTTIELAACLVILVSLFRAYLAGGYMIETGSMAPCLLGKHRPVVCPSCKFPFAVEGTGTAARAVCPNCGEGGIAVDGLPDNDGDHLLVHRSMYELRSPRRWEVIVFQNPNKPQQAYVKRLVGMPGEIELQIKRATSMSQVRSRPRITPRNGACASRFTTTIFARPTTTPNGGRAGSSIARTGIGTPPAGNFVSRPPRKHPPDQLEWVNYRHWIRQGGGHLTSVPMASWPESLESLQGGFGPLRYDADAGTLICRGVLPAKLRDQLLAGVGDTESRRAIEAAERERRTSHRSSITTATTGDATDRKERSSRSDALGGCADGKGARRVRAGDFGWNRRIPLRLRRRAKSAAAHRREDQPHSPYG